MPSKQGYDQIMKDEGFHPRAINDRDEKGRKVGSKVLGYGYNLDVHTTARQDLLDSGINEEDVDPILKGEKDITEEQGRALFQISLNRAVADARRVVSNFDDLDPEVKDVLVNMTYQIGAKGLSGFRKMRNAIDNGDYQLAAKELLNSRYGQLQTPNRAERLAKQLVEYGKTVKKPPEPKTTNYVELIKQQQFKVNVERLSKVYNRLNLEQRLKAAMDNAPPSTPKEGEKVETKAREEDTKEPPVRPFKAGEFVDNKDGSHSTERTVTIQDSAGNWVNVPSLWMGPSGPIDFGTDEQLITDALNNYEKSGVKFKRFETLDSAVKAAKERSSKGGAFSGENR